MITSGGFSREERDKLLTEYWESNAKTSWPLRETLDSKLRSAEYRKQDKLLDEYAERLPFVAIARCPYSGNVVEFPMDPYGFDGIWWKIRELADYPSAAGSDYLRLVTGGVNFHGRQPLEAKRLKEVRPGPGCPFVIPTILSTDGVLAVLSQLDLPFGDTAYLTTYFSEEPIHGGLLSQPWGRDSYQVFNEAGEYEGWTIDKSPWDFDLLPWIEDGKLSWIVPDDERFELRGDSECPYVGIDGVQRPQLIRNGEMKVLELPDGQPAQPFE